MKSTMIVSCNQAPKDGVVYYAVLFGYNERYMQFLPVLGI